MNLENCGINFWSSVKIAYIMTDDSLARCQCVGHS